MRDVRGAETEVRGTRGTGARLLQSNAAQATADNMRGSTGAVNKDGVTLTELAQQSVELPECHLQDNTWQKMIVLCKLLSPPPRLVRRMVEMLPNVASIARKKHAIQVAVTRKFNCSSGFTTCYSTGAHCPIFPRWAGNPTARNYRFPHG